MVLKVGEVGLNRTKPYKNRMTKRDPEYSERGEVERLDKQAPEPEPRLSAESCLK